MTLWHFNNKSSRIIVQNTVKKAAEAQVKANQARGFVPLMDIKEEIDVMGRAYYVCVMENPKLKEANDKKRALEKEKNPS